MTPTELLALWAAAQESGEIRPRVRSVGDSGLGEGFLCSVFHTPNGRMRGVVAHPALTGDFALVIYRPEHIEKVDP